MQCVVFCRPSSHSWNGRVAAAELLLLLLLDARHSASAPSFARTCMVSMGVAA